MREDREQYVRRVVEAMGPDVNYALEYRRQMDRFIQADLLAREMEERCSSR